MRSGRMPSLIHHTLSRESRPRAMEAKGTPLSVRIRVGKPNSQKSRPKTRLVPTKVVPAQALTAEQITAAAVLDGERVAVDAVEGLELALEVGAPDRVGLIEGRRGLARVGALAAASSLLDQAPSLEVGLQRPLRGDVAIGVELDEPGPDLAAPQRLTAAVAEADRFLDQLRIGRPGTVVGSPRAILEAPGPSRS
jgi:hypothetical protein